MGKAKRPLPKRLPNKLKTIRVNLECSMEKLADKLNSELQLLGFPEVKIYSGYIADYESGKREPYLPVLLIYSILSKINLNELIDDRVEISLQHLKSISGL